MCGEIAGHVSYHVLCVCVCVCEKLVKSIVIKK